jgi:hypothetical protein
LTPSCKHPPSSSATYVLKWPTRYLWMNVQAVICTLHRCSKLWN